MERTAVNEKIFEALKSDKTIDITTTGKTSGKTRRIEIWFHNVEDQIYISGSPGTRDWYANMLKNPDFIFHLKESVKADLSAKAKPILNSDKRREILSKFDGQRNLDEWVLSSPLVEIEFERVT